MHCKIAAFSALPLFVFLAHPKDNPLLASAPHSLFSNSSTVMHPAPQVLSAFELADDRD
jgi:hypothetical protein